MILYFIRHAEPIYEPDSLTENGYIQAQKLANELKKYNIEKIFSSTSNRANLTAKPTAELKNLDIELVDFANEKYAWEGLTFDDESGRHWMFQAPKYIEFFNRKDVLDLEENWYTHPEISSKRLELEINRISKCTDDFLMNLGYEKIMPGKYKINKVRYNSVALFAHQGFGLCFLSNILGVIYPQFCTHFDLKLASITTIDFVEIDGFAYPKIIMMSNDSHLLN